MVEQEEDIQGAISALEDRSDIFNVDVARIMYACPMFFHHNPIVTDAYQYSRMDIPCSRNACTATKISAEDELTGDALIKEKQTASQASGRIHALINEKNGNNRAMSGKGTGLKMPSSGHDDVGMSAKSVSAKRSIPVTEVTAGHLSNKKPRSRRTKPKQSCEPFRIPVRMSISQSPTGSEGG